jgi:RNA polymerase sigma-70 factor, ECF subfamily
MLVVAPLLARPAPVPAGDPGDELLVARILAGDERAFDQLYLRHARYLAGTLHRLLGNDLELDDFVQDTFVIALDRLASLRDPRQVRGWLTTIAVRLARKRLVTRDRRRRFREQVGEASPGSSDPRDRAPADELYEALDMLPAKLRIPWILARVSGESLTDTALACEVSLATVKRRIAAAQDRLDTILAGGAR